MFVHFLLTFTSIFLLYFANLSRVDKFNSKILLCVVFILIFLFQSLRYEYGNDYNAYLEIYNYIKDDREYYLGDRIEAGWVILNEFFNKLGLNFFHLIGFISLLQLSILYVCITKYVDYKYYWLSIFSYLVVVDNMLIQLSAMRQTIAIFELFLTTIFLLKKKYILAVLSFFVAYNFHNSALIAAIPLLLILVSNFFKDSVYFVLCIVLFIFFLFCGDLFLLLVSNTLGSSAEKYFIYNEVGTVSSGFIFIYSFVLMVICSSSLKNAHNFFEKTIIKIIGLSFLFVPLSIYVGMLVRINFYYEFFYIIGIPLLIKLINNYILKIFILIIFLLWHILVYIKFFYNDIWFRGFYNYKTILPLFF